MSHEFSLRPATRADLPEVSRLKEAALRSDLERLGVWHPERSRARILAAFSPERTRMILDAAGSIVGCISVRAEDDDTWIELFYIDPAYQGAGLGTAVLRRVLGDLSPTTPVRLNVLQGSRAESLYERHGFVRESADDIDVFMVRPAPTR